MFGKPNTALKLAKLAASTVNLDDKKVVVVGGTDGLGRAVAHLAASRGAKVTVVGRTFRDEGVKNISFMKADLSLTREAERIGRELPADTDIAVFTTGIMPASTRQLSAEGLEMDMAVSTMSRHVALKTLMPRLRPQARTFVMGFPGAGQAGELGDLNSDKKYDGGLGATHMNTVAGNEALVHHWAARGARVYGLNPGLVKTNIRHNVHGNGFLGSLLESALGLFTPTPDQYAENVLPLMVAPELDDAPGALFGQSGTPILPTPAFTDPKYVDQWITELDALEKRAAQARATSAPAPS